MFQKLDDVVIKHEELTELLMVPHVACAPIQMTEYN